MAYDLNGEKHVFINWDLIEPGYGVAWAGEVPTSWEMPYGVRIAVHSPRIDPEPLVWPEHEWESLINVYSTLFEDEGRYRLYYECHHVPETEQPEDLKAMMAYAESTDGKTWVKPKIGNVSFKGSTDNNLVYGLELSLGRGAHGATVFKDPNASPDQRYKLVHMAREKSRLGVFGAVSPDGLIWKPVEDPLLLNYMSDTQTVVRFDEEKGRYVGYFRGWRGMELGSWHGRRTIAYAESDTFESWPVPQSIVEPDVIDNPDTDIYTNAYTPWPGAAQAHLMFPAFYQRSADALEVHLMTSRDGVNWERPSRKPIVPRGEPGSDWEGGVYAGCGLVSLKSGEWSLPIGPKWHTHNQGHFSQGRPEEPPNHGFLCRALWRQDGITSLEAESEGKCTTVPVTFTGRQLEVNAWTQFAGEVRFELAEVSGDPVAGHTFEDCDAISGDVLQHTVSWKGESDLSTWAGKPMRLRLWLRRARLHAIQFV